MEIDIRSSERRDFSRALQALTDAGVEFIVAGAYALHHYTGIWRDTKDLDLFLRPRDLDRALAVLAEDGFTTEVLQASWLAKARAGGSTIDLIHGSGNWLAPVDDLWFTHAEPANVLGVDVKVAPAEETIWSKSYVAERHRYDGHDLTHLLRARGSRLDWQRLLDRFGQHGELLLSYLYLFRFVYPDEREAIPGWVFETLQEASRAGAFTPEQERVCRGPLVSRYSYLFDLLELGYQDPREELARRRGLDVTEVIATRLSDRHHVPNPPS